MTTNSSLFQPLDIGSLRVPNRIVMAPLTRCRAEKNIPNAMMAEYYAQRASAGLIISEATQVSPMGIGYPNTPGIHSPEQVEAWKTITAKVHELGGKIFLQLWHVGRVSHPLLIGGEQPIAPSALAIEGAEVYTPKGKQPYPVPRALESSEIPGIVELYRTGALNAQRANFDGVEIHAANGYLIDQFLRDGSNIRTDKYGGSIENRCRFLLEVCEAVSSVWESGRIGVRFSPRNPFNGMKDSDPIATFSYAAKELNKFGFAYLHVVEPTAGSPFGAEGERVTPHLRKICNSRLVANGGYDGQSASEAIESNAADAVAFGVPFISNPDLPERLKIGAELSPSDPKTYYSPGPRGYTDYPKL